MLGTGLWVHGRILGAVNWHGLVLGEGSARMGLLPTALYIALNLGRDLGPIGFGTGSSKTDDGTFESEVLKELLCKQAEHFAQQYPLIGDHPNWINLDVRRHILGAFRVAFVDTDTQRTNEEIILALDIMKGRARHVMAVTCGGHAPRCINLVAKLTRDGVMPPAFWSVIPDQMTFGAPTVVIEPPHRPDCLDESPLLATAMAHVAAMPPAEKGRIARLINQATQST